MFLSLSLVLSLCVLPLTHPHQCGKTTLHAANSIVLDGGKPMRCAWWSEGSVGPTQIEAKGWRTDGCTVKNAVTATRNVTGSGTHKEMTMTCECLLKTPPYTKFRGDFAMVEFVADLVAKSFGVSTPFSPSRPTLLLCGVPLVACLILIVYFKLCGAHNDDAWNEPASAKSLYVSKAGKTHTILTKVFSVKRLEDLIELESIPRRSRSGSTVDRIAGSKLDRNSCCWWWWQSMKQDHDMLVPFMGRQMPGKNKSYYFAMWFAKYVEN